MGERESFRVRRRLVAYLVRVRVTSPPTCPRFGALFWLSDVNLSLASFCDDCISDERSELPLYVSVFVFPRARVLISLLWGIRTAHSLYHLSAARRLTLAHTPSPLVALLRQALQERRGRAEDQGSGGRRSRQDPLQLQQWRVRHLHRDVQREEGEGLCDIGAEREVQYSDIMIELRVESFTLAKKSIR